MDLRFLLIVFFCLPASAQLITRAQLIPLSNSVANLNGATNGLTTRVNNLDGSTNAIDALVRTKQHGTALLTNWQGTGVLTNIVNGSTNWPAGQVGLLGPTNNGDVRIKSISQGSNITLTDQGTNVAISGNITNALVQTNGVNVGSIGTVNFIGATGAVISGVATIGGFGGSSTTTNFVVTAHGAITVTNGIYSGIAGTSGRIYSWDDTFGDYWQLFFIDDSQFKIGESGLDTSIFGSTIALRAGTIYPMPEASGLYTQLGVPTQRYSLAWFGPTGLFAGRLSLTNYPGEGNPSLEWRDTNGQGYTRIQRTNNANIKDTNVWWMSFNNPSAGQVRKIHSVTWDAAGVAHIVETNAADNTGGAGSSVFNINQFSASATHTNIKDGALVTNMVAYGFTNNGAVSNSGAAFLGGFLDAKGPNTNRVQLNLPHLTASRSAVINAQGDVTNSSAASNWSLYDTNLLFGAAGNSGDVQFNQSGVLAGTNRVVWNRTNENLVVRGVSSGLVFGTNFGIYIEDVLTLATNTIGPTHIGQRGNVDFSLVTSNVLRWTVNGDGTLYPRSSDNGTMDLGTSSSAVRTQFVNHVNVGTAIHGRTSNAVPSGAFLFPWNTNFANRVQAKEGVSWGNDGAAYYTLEATNAVKTTNIMRYSLTNPVAGQIYKFHSVENLSGGQVIITVTNDVDNSGGAGAGILTNANQFGAAGATVTIKESALLTNTIFYSSDTNRTNVALQQAIGQAVPMFSIRDSNNAPVVEFDNRGFLLLTNSLTNYNLGNTRATPANTIAVGVEDFGGFIVPAWFKDSKLNWAINPARWNSRTYTLFPSAGTTVGADGVTTANAGGTTVAHTTPDERLPYMVSVSSAATSNSVGAVSMTVNLANAGAHNGSSKASGYFFHTEWCNTNIIAQVVGGGAPRFFIGLANAATPNLTNIVNTTNATGQYIGLMADPVQSLNMYITARDGSAEFRTNTGINFKATNIFQISLYNSPTNRFVGWKLKDLTDRLEATGVFSNNVPTNFMKGTIMVKNGTNRNCEIRFSKMYLQAPLTPQ